MKRGDLVTVVMAGDYGKPRPALISQSDAYELHPSVTLLPLSSTIVDMGSLRIILEPSAKTGLRVPSQIMVDKVATIPRAKVGRPIGRVDNATLGAVSTSLATFLGLV